MSRKAQYLEALAGVPEMTDEEIAYQEEITKQNLGLLPKKTMKDMTNEELKTLEQDIRDSENYVELHSTEFGENLELARGVLKMLDTQLKKEKQNRGM